MRLKKKLLILPILLMLCVFVNESHAQTRVGYGLRGGVNISNLNDTDLNTDSHTGLMLGLYFDYAFANSPVMLQPEVLYTQKGFEQGNKTFRVDYLEVPVLARFNFITDSGTLPYVYFGPYIGFKVNTDFPNQPQDIANGNIYNDDAINSTDFGVTVGGGVNFGRIDLGVRYEAGLTEISDDDAVSAKNGVFSIVAGIGF